MALNRCKRHMIKPIKEPKVTATIEEFHAEVDRVSTIFQQSYENMLNRVHDKTRKQHTLEDIIKKGLEFYGYDGLYFENECGCLKNNLCPCGQESVIGCLPGYLRTHDWHIGKEKQCF